MWWIYKHTQLNGPLPMVQPTVSKLCAVLSEGYYPNKPLFEEDGERCMKPGFRPFTPVPYVDHLFMQHTHTKVQGSCCRQCPPHSVNTVKPFEYDTQWG
jgi:hypothetical protein